MQKFLKRIFYLFLLFVSTQNVFAQLSEPSSKFTIARLKYRGGGDWYNDPSAIPNLLQFLKQHTNLQVAEDEQRVGIMDQELFSFPVIFMTGHGRIEFSDEEASRLRNYLEHGGFLYADDDYGMDKFFRTQIKKVFPDKKLVELPFSHPIYHSHFQFGSGLPKIHEHDGGPPHGYAIFHQGRMVVFYSFNTNISDGWVDPEVHGDPEDVRREAFKMGTNIIVYALTH
ncbi:hypothetical protein B6D60_03810 [candidate division KSB1 bacterium 4484_87]|nr:MAG: hypothetical protein B6D60_03810 [candidate division KSB1 bacterium 4484_87]